MTGNSTAAVGERKGRGPVVGPQRIHSGLEVTSQGGLVCWQLDQTSQEEQPAMSVTTVIVLNAVLDCAVLVALAYVMLLPFRLDRRPATYAVTDSTAEQRQRLAA
jgi:hypothetical protein